MPQSRRAKQAGTAALDRLQAAMDAADVAFKDLRKEASRDTRDLMRDLGKTITDARRNLTRSRKRIVKDLVQIEQALVSGKSPGSSARRTTTSTPGARQTAARRTSTRTTRTPAASKS